MKTARVCCLLAAAACAVTVRAGVQCEGQVNESPIYSGAPKLMMSVPNGNKYTVGPPSLSPNITVVDLYGSPYEIGYAYGSLLKEELALAVPDFQNYFLEQINETLPHLSHQQQEWILEHGVMGALNLTWWAARDHIPAHYTQRIQGIADGSGQDWGMIMKIAMLPEMIKMSCSMAGAWGDATADGGLVQLRALDWTTNGPFQKYPLIMNVHPLEGQGHTYTVVGWIGMVGAITGMASNGVGISEKVWLQYKGKDNVFGVPSTFLLEDILHFDFDGDSALARIASANRTCSFFIGIGDNTVPSQPSFKVVEYSYQEVNIYNWANFPNYTNHDLFKDLVFVNKHEQPSGDPCMNDLFHESYGAINATYMARNVCGQQQTGDMHLAVYDFPNSKMYVGNAAPVQPDGSVVPAYVRPMVEVDVGAWWSLSSPKDTYPGN